MYRYGTIPRPGATQETSSSSTVDDRTLVASNSLMEMGEKDPLLVDETNPPKATASSSSSSSAVGRKKSVRILTAAATGNLAKKAAQAKRRVMRQQGPSSSSSNANANANANGNASTRKAPVFGRVFQKQSLSSSSRTLTLTERSAVGVGDDAPDGRHDDDDDDDDHARDARKTSHRHGTHSFVYTMLNPRSRRWHATMFKTFISAVICIDLCFFVCSTEPRFSRGGSHHEIFKMEEAIVSTIFLTEYLARLLTIMESRHYQQYGPIMGRFRYMTTWNAIVDALSTAPYFVELGTGVELPTLTYLRVFRLLRILKTQGFANAIDAVYRVIYYNVEILTVALLICIILVLVTGVAMYYLRPPDDPDGTFGSILRTTYTATLMLTGQGGPDASENLPWYTKLVILMTSFFSVAMFAIPASMLTWGFEAEAARLAAVSRRKRLAKRAAAEARAEAAAAAGVDPDDDDYGDGASDGDGSSTSSEWASHGEGSDSSDEEYQKIIAGEDDGGGGDGDDKEEDELKEKLLRVFRRADSDYSGSLSMKEFVDELEKSKELTGSLTSPSGGAAAGVATPATTTATPATREDLERLESRVNELSSRMDEILRILLKQ